MSKKCAKCDKTVYPTEELKCLDKVWHKICFKCTECGMALTMKNYKGFNKMPYCSAHYPQLKATVVVDTPQQKLLDHLTKQQSQVEYHKEYEASKGTVTAMAEDPEMMRIKQVANVISQASYTGRNRDSNPGETSYTRPLRTSAVEDDEPNSYSRDSRSYAQANPMARMLPLPGQNMAPPLPQSPPVTAVPAFQAMYDYDAQDDDEVSFVEGDVITNCQTIDEGWVIGVVKRTGLKGMIPANYIEAI